MLTTGDSGVPLPRGVGGQGGGAVIINVSIVFFISVGRSGLARSVRFPRLNGVGLPRVDRTIGGISLIFSVRSRTSRIRTAMASVGVSGSGTQAHISPSVVSRVSVLGVAVLTCSLRAMHIVRQGLLGSRISVIGREVGRQVLRASPRGLTRSVGR